MLKRKKLTIINGEFHWVNAYEFGLFCEASTCVLLAKTMQSNGSVYEETVAPNIQILAKDRHAQKRVMNVIYWDLDVVRAFAKRNDGHFFLQQGEYNGYEMGLHEDCTISKRLGELARRHTASIADVVKFEHFKEIPLEHIYAYYNYK